MRNGGARSSAEEHLGDIEGVVGSNPTAPTIKTLALKAGVLFCSGLCLDLGAHGAGLGQKLYLASKQL